MKISVIMASFLGNFGRERKNLDKKFIRAVKSFLNQTYEDKELIIVSDGCQITNKIYEENWLKVKNVKLFKSAKLPLYSGGIRDIGIKMAEGDIITYLDADDIIGKNHLKTIYDQFDIDKYDWVYYDDLLSLDAGFKKFEKRWVQLRWSSIGTSSISHINYYKYKDRFSITPSWPTGYGHDFVMALKLSAGGGRFKKLEKMPQYIVCHTANTDF